MNKGNITNIISIIIIIILGTGVGLLATKIWNPSWNPFVKKQGQMIIEKAIAKTLQSETYKFEEEVQAEIEFKKAEQTGKFDASVNFAGVVDQSNLQEPKLNIDFNVQVAVEGAILKGAGQMKSLDQDTIYLKITELPSIPFLPLGDIKNQWLKIDMGRIKEIESPKPVINVQILKKEVEQIMKDKEIFKIEKNFGKEQIEKEKMQHYLTSMKKDSVKTLIPEFAKLMKKYQTEMTQAEYEKNMNEFLKKFDENFDNVWTKISPIEFNVWIDQKDYLRRIKFEKKLDSNQLTAQSILKDEPQEKINSLNLSIDIKFSEFNKPVEIEAPKEYKDIQEFLSSIMNSGSLPQQGIESLPKDLKSIPKMPEISEELIPQFPSFPKE